MKTVLIIDDMAVLRQPIAAMLKVRGYQVMEAENGEEGLACLGEVIPDLILLDLAMPKMDGREFLQKLSEMGRSSIPVILLTAVTDKDYVLETARLGVSDYMLKSRFSLEELIEKVNKCAPLDGDSEANSSNDAPDEPVQRELSDRSSDLHLGEVKSSASTKRRPVFGAYTPDIPASEYLKQLPVLISKQAMSETIENCRELKAMSPTVTQLIKLTRSKEATLSDITQVVKQDQAVALKILKIANSAVYNRGKTVESVHQAVMNIGVEQIRQVALNIAVIDSFSNVPEGEKAINLMLFWEHAIAVGLIGTHLARDAKFKPADLERVFTMGLLHDLGRVVLYDMLTNECQYALDAAAHYRLPVEVVESRMLGMTHADLVEQVLKQWHFPENLVAPISMHHLSLSNIRSKDQDVVTAAQLIALSNRLAHAMCLGPV